MSAARRHLLVPLFAVMAVATLGAIAAPHPAHGTAIIMVNTTADEDISNPFCSLREAIIAANTNANYHGCSASGAGVNDVIVFRLPGTGTHTLNIGTTPLPPITEWVTIDGGAERVELHGPGGPQISGRHGLTVITDGFGTTIRNLIINNFPDDGIFINADEVSVLGCFIGTDATGMTAVPNQGFGVQVFGGNGVRIGGATSGGPCTGDCNVISGAKNPKANVLLDLHATGARVRGNFIGTNATGTTAISPNDAQGIIDKGGVDRIGGANGTTPGGACTGDCNLISSTNSNGAVFIDPAATGSIIQGNFIGTDVTGNNSISNGASGIGILSRAAGAMIGGTTPAARNLVSGNAGTGIFVAGPATTVRGNYVGTNSAGTLAVPNGIAGIKVEETNGATIGGTTPGTGNLISGTGSGSGVEIVLSTNTQIVGNLIGTAADGITPVPNLGQGVFIRQQSSTTTVGGQIAGAGNTIAFNVLTGVRVEGPQANGNTIRGNSIYSNEDGGIALTDGGNDNLAAPSINGIAPLHGTACAHCTVEIFSDAENEGRVFEGSVFTNDGNWTFNGLVSGPHVTATNTDMSNNTSEFSSPVSVTTRTPTPTSTATASNTETATPTNPATPTSMPSATHTPTDSPTVVPTSTGTPTETPTVTSAPTQTPLATTTGTPTAQTATPTVTPVVCVGDCDRSGAVTVDELITGVNIALGTLPLDQCTLFDASGSGTVTVDEILTAVNNALGGCAG